MTESVPGRAEFRARAPDRGQAKEQRSLPEIDKHVYI